MVGASSIPFLILLCWTGPASPGPLQQRASLDPSAKSTAQSAAAAKPPVVSEKETAPVRVAYLEHVGPYWALSSIVAEVQHAMLEAKEAGPLFVRYFGDPRGLGAAGIRMHVGFVVQGTRDPGPPFHADRWPQGRAAYLLIDGAFGAGAEHHAVLLQWTKENGYETNGTLTELYWIGGGKGGREIVEVQLALGERRFDPATAVVEKETTEDVGAPSQSTGISPGDSPATMQRIDVDDDDADSVRGSQMAPTEPVAVLEVETIDGAAKAGPDKAKAVDASVVHVIGAIGDAEGASVRELLLRAEPEAVADFLLVGWNELSDAGRLFLDHFVSRLSALERGLERRGQAQSTTRIRLILAAIAHRYDDLHNSRGTVITPQPTNPSVRRFSRKSLMYELDRFLSQVAMGSLPVEVIEQQTVGFIAQARDLLRADEVDP